MQHKKIVLLNNHLSLIEGYVPSMNIRNPNISVASVGWHLDHSLKVINRISESIKSSNPNDFKKDFNIKRSILFILCYIPRKRGKCPKSTTPPNNILIADLKAQINVSRAHLGQIAMLDKNTHFKHFIFGNLSKVNTLRFLEMHTRHHLKIVRDILNTQDQSKN